MANNVQARGSADWPTGWEAMAGRGFEPWRFTVLGSNSRHRGSVQHASHDGLAAFLTSSRSATRGLPCGYRLGEREIVTALGQVLPRRRGWRERALVACSVKS